jgi:iron(III) transport system permease protein
MRPSPWVVLPAWLLFAALVYLPMEHLVLDAFVVGGHWDLSLMGEQLLAADPWHLLGTSLVVGAGSSALAVLIGVPYALFLQSSNLPARALFKVLYLVPLVIPPHIHALVWSRVSAEQGPVNRFLQAMTGTAEPPLDLFGVYGVIFVLAVSYFPFVSLLTTAGLQSLDRSLEEASLLRHGPLRTMTGVNLPLVLPHVLSGAILVFVFAIIDFGVADLLRVRVYPVEIFIYFSALYDKQAAVMLGLPLVLVTLVLVLFQAWIMRDRSYVSFAHGALGISRFALGRLRLPALLFCTLVLGLSVVVPVGVLIGAVGPASVFIKEFEASSEAIGGSFVIAVASGLAMTALAFVIANSMRHSGPGMRALLHYASQVPFAIPPILLGVGIIDAWNRPATGWFYDSVAIVVLGHVARFIPFVIIAVHASLQQMNPRLEEMGALMTSSRVRVACVIVWPLLRPGLTVAFLIGFVLAFGELGVTLLIVPPGTETIPVRIYNLIHYGAADSVAALALGLLVLQLLFILAALAGVRWSALGAR